MQSRDPEQGAKTQHGQALERLKLARQVRLLTRRSRGRHAGVTTPA
jgi:hypothetical protein